MNKHKIFSVIMLIWLLSSCANGAIEVQEAVQEETKTQEQKIESFKQNIGIAKQQFISSQNNSQSVSSEEIDDDKTLLVNNKCIACNKCIRIAPDNFTMDWENRIAVVTSQEGIYSDQVATAIARCPTDAIEIG